MKRTIAISILFVFLSANTELHQLLKLPVLIHHFLEHLKKDHQESFADLLIEHYSDTPNHSDNDHDNLPFKTNDCATIHNSTVAFIHQHHFSLCQPMIVFDNISVSSKVEFSSSAFLSNIWQPPKIS